MRPVTLAILAFLICFGVGALLSALSGFGSQDWFPGGIAASSVVAIYVFRSFQKKTQTDGV
jgi:membrane protein implicated in regulation of membrane protease activity